MSRFTSSLLVLALVLSIAPLQIQAVRTTLAQCASQGIKMSSGHTLFCRNINAVSPSAAAQRGLKQSLLGNLLANLPIVGGLLGPTLLGGAVSPGRETLTMVMDVVSPSSGKVTPAAMVISSITDAAGAGRRLMQAPCADIILNLNEQPVQAGDTPFRSDDINIDISSRQVGVLSSVVCLLGNLVATLQVQQLVFVLNKLLVSLLPGIVG